MREKPDDSGGFALWQGVLGCASVPAEAEGVACRIEVDAEWITRCFTRLDFVSGRSECEHLAFDLVDVIDGQVEVALLRSLAAGPCRSFEVRCELEGDAAAIHDQRHPVALLVGDLSAQEAAVEVGERPWLGAVEDHRTKASEWCGHAAESGRCDIGRPR